MIRRRDWLLAPLVLSGVACSEAPKQTAKKEPEPPPEPVAGLKAFYQMFTYARQWATDIQPIQVSSIVLPDIPAAGGKFPAWQCMLVSPSMRRLKTFTYSVVEAEGNLHKGVFAHQEESFSGTRGQARPFLIQAFKIDSDKAYDVAMKEGAAFAKKHPDMPMMFQLELTPRFPNPAWRVMWGETVATSAYSVFVDATTGDFLQKTT